MKLSLLWYLTDYSDGLHTYYHILSKCSTQVSVNLIHGWSIDRGKYMIVLKDSSIHRNDIFEVKNLPLPVSYNTSFNSPL